MLCTENRLTVKPPSAILDRDKADPGSAIRYENYGY